MKIRFGTTHKNKDRALVLGFCCFWLAWLLVYLQGLFDGSYQVNIRLHRPNATSTELLPGCVIGYDECRYSFSSNRSERSDYCLTDIQSTSHRILLLAILILHVVVIHDLFAISGNHVHFIVQCLRVIAVFIFILTTITIYWSRCFYFFMSLGSPVTSAILLMLVFRDDQIRKDEPRTIIYVERSNVADNGIKSWCELL